MTRRAAAGTNTIRNVWGRARFGWTYGALVTDRLRFAVHQTLLTRRPQKYMLSTGSEVIALRHHASDVFALIEVFDQQIYEPPELLLIALAPILGERPLQILDLGAHVGSFAIWALRRFPGAHVVSVEAAPSTYPLLLTALESHSGDATWVSLHAAASVTYEVASMLDTGGTDARLEESDAAAQVQTLDVLPLVADADLVKIDIEGQEFRLLGDPRWRTEPRPTALIVEFHGPDAARRDQLAAASLDEAGYETVAVASGLFFALKRND